MDIQLSNSVYDSVYGYSPTGIRCTTRSIAKKSPTGSLPPAVPLAITRTFRPWTHTSDDSYIYQLSLVVATATVSYNRNTNISIDDNDNDESTTHPPSWRFVVSRHHYLRPCIFRVLKVNVRAFRSCRAATYTAMRDKDRTMLLLSCCLALCPLAPWQAFHFLSFYRIVIE